MTDQLWVREPGLPWRVDGHEDHDCTEECGDPPELPPEDGTGAAAREGTPTGEVYAFTVDSAGAFMVGEEKPPGWIPVGPALVHIAPLRTDPPPPPRVTELAMRYPNQAWQEPPPLPPDAPLSALFTDRRVPATPPVTTATQHGMVRSWRTECQGCEYVHVYAGADLNWQQVGGMPVTHLCGETLVHWFLALETYIPATEETP